MKQPNKVGAPLAEAAEEGPSPKGNGGQTAAARTLRRDTASNGLAAVRRAAQQSKSVRFTALLHHITIDLLEQSYCALEQDSAAGVDGVTWQAYGENLEEKLTWICTIAYTKAATAPARPGLTSRRRMDPGGRSGVIFRGMAHGADNVSNREPLQVGKTVGAA